MGGSSSGSDGGRNKRHRHLINCVVTLFIISNFINCCNAYFYSEKRNDSGEDRNCFCEVNIFWPDFPQLFMFHVLISCTCLILQIFWLFLFWQLKGSIDDCSCSIDTVDYFNNNKIHPRLKSLLVRDYFRFHKVNLKKECPFWADDSKCAMRACHVSTCSESDVPEGLKGQHQQESFVFKVRQWERWFKVLSKYRAY